MHQQPSHTFDVIAAFMSLASHGAAWVLWLMIVMSVALGGIIFERFLLYRRTQIDASRMGHSLLVLLQEGQFEEAKRLVAGARAVEERVVSDGLAVWQRGPLAVEQIMKASLVRERQRFEHHLSFLGTVGSNAPFVGLLGTVIGIVVSFQKLGANPKGGMAVVGPGIAEALASTAVGLMVAIPAVVAFNAFQVALERRVGNVEFLTGVLLSQCHQEQ